jgi:hypothetical protein
MTDGNVDVLEKESLISAHSVETMITGTGNEVQMDGGLGWG